MNKEILQWCINLLEVAVDEDTSHEVSRNVTEEVLDMLKHLKDK